MDQQDVLAGLLPWQQTAMGLGPGQQPWGSPYATVPFRALPYGDMAMPLGNHLTQATREKILRGEFVDIFSLLFRDLKKKDKEDMEEKDRENLRRRNVDRT